jgi:hypothetical protein
MLTSIAELQKMNIDPALPDISSTFSAVKKYRTKGQTSEEQTINAKDKP